MARFYFGSHLLVVFIIGLSSSIHAGGDKIFNAAEKLFEDRGESVENIHKARSLYLKIIKDKKESLGRRTTALDRYARLTVFEGEVAKERFDVKDVSKIFKECLDATEYLSPKNIGVDTAEYTYWRSMCLGLWGANAGKAEMLFHIGRISELKNLVNLGMERFRTFDGYGFNRIMAGMYVRSKALSALNLYHPDLALELIEEALADGTDNYMGYILKAEALYALDKRQEAVDALEFGINELKDRLSKGSIPIYLVQENHIFLIKMYELLDRLSQA